MQYNALKLQNAGQAAEAGVIQLLRDSKLSSLCYAYKIRTKPEEKLIEKVHRKKETKSTYALEHVTDVVGLRLVALFREEMVDLFHGIISAMLHLNGVSPNPFKQKPPEEIIIYKGTNAFDELAPRLKEIVATLCPSAKVCEEHSREGYSSVHLVTRINSNIGTVFGGKYSLPIEIQIRSVFEDAWGEIDHKYGYVIRAGKDAGTPINNPDLVLAHLKVLKHFSDACMDYADVIRAEALGGRASLVNSRKVISVNGDESLVEKFQVLGVNSDIITKYATAIKKKEDAGVTMDKYPADGINKYIATADEFRTIAEEVSLLDGGVKESRGCRLMYYHLKMNEALCLLSTNKKEQVVASISIYNSLESEYCNYPLLLMRLGQAFGKLGYIDEAIKKLRGAGTVSAEISKSFDDSVETEWPDNYSKADQKHISQRLPKLLGYHLWLKIRNLGVAGDATEKLALYLEAYEVTLQGLASAEGDNSIILSMQNNLLYYSIGIVNYLRSDDSRVNDFKEKIRGHITFIEDNGPAPELWTLPTTDTLMKAYAFLGNEEKARHIGNLLIGKCLKLATAEYEAEETLALMRVANQIITGEKFTFVD